MTRSAGPVGTGSALRPNRPATLLPPFLICLTEPTFTGYGITLERCHSERSLGPDGPGRSEESQQLSFQRAADLVGFRSELEYARVGGVHGASPPATESIPVNLFSDPAAAQARASRSRFPRVRPDQVAGGVPLPASATYHYLGAIALRHDKAEYPKHGTWLEIQFRGKARS